MFIGYQSLCNKKYGVIIRRWTEQVIGKQVRLGKGSQPNSYMILELEISRIKFNPFLQHRSSSDIGLIMFSQSNLFHRAAVVGEMGRRMTLYTVLSS